MLKIHFLNVGHGDCIVVEFCDSNRAAVIDVNRSSDMNDDTKKEIEQELFEKVTPAQRMLYLYDLISFADLAKAAGETMTIEDPVEFIKTQKIDKIFRFISTHPHMDHLTGLVALNKQAPIQNYWILNNEFEQDESKLSDEQNEDWELYQSYRDGGSASPITVIRPINGDQRSYLKEDGIFVLAPNRDLIDLAKAKNNRNIMSYVLLIQYRGRKIVLGGDAEKDSWDFIVENYADLIKGVSILKASHHGRDSGYHQEAVKLMNPTYTIVSVGKKPDTDASGKYRQYCSNVWSTRWKGNISFFLNDDGTWEYSAQHNR